ncbi:hypothetical protein GE09DRAFT_1225083 [Coniochaeta sp. 2T2.1]|nr:hypothetical protein GE09DRAFT_1225083 [Coniochaeta sp. 2T2.1]
MASFDVILKPIYDDILDLGDFDVAAIDALVNDHDDDPVIPSSSRAASVSAFDRFNRPVTPAIPPGLGPKPTHLSPAVSHSSLQNAVVERQTPPVVTPVTPLKPPPGVLGPKKAGATARASASATATPTAPAAASGSEAKKNIKALAVESGLAGDIASQASNSKTKTFLQEEDFPALDTPKTAPSTVGTPGAQQKAQPAKSVPALTKKEKKAEKQKGKQKEKEETREKEKDKENQAAKPTEKPDEKPSEKPADEASASAASMPVKPAPEVSEKRPVPGILNIAAATRAASQSKPVDSPKTTSKSATTEKSATEKDSAFPALPTPSTASVMSPAARAAPKTLRVVPTPKTEIPSMTLPGAVRSATTVVRPETPGSEIISDSTSVVSAGVSLSRTSSPPPSRVGAAPLRTATKSQQRKARKDAVKKDTEIIVTPKIEPEVEIAPIVGRKKKQKKEKTVASSSNATPTESRPQTPVLKESAAPAKEAKETKEVKDDSSAYRSTAHETMSLTEDKPPVRVDNKDKGKDIDTGSTDPGSSRLPAVQPTPASTFQKLVEEGALLGPVDNLALLKPIPSLNDKHRHDAGPSTSLLAKDLLEKDLLEPQTKSIVNEEDQAALLEGRPVRKLVDGLRVMLTPYGDCVRNLSPEEEDRFLALQERVAQSSASPAAFVSSRHEPAGGFSLIRGRAVPNGPPGYFPSAPGAYPQDPVNKIQREEAIYYINQYVLPRINLGTTGFPGVSSIKDSMSVAAGAGGGKAQHHTAAAVTTLANEFTNTMAPYMDNVAAPELSYPAPAPGGADVIHGGHGHHHHGHAHHNHNAQQQQQHSNNIANALVTHLGATWPEHDHPGSSAAAGVKKFPSGPHTMSNGAPFGSVPLMSLEDAEQALAAARKETEKLEKTLNQTIKKNRRLLQAMAMGGGGGGQQQERGGMMQGGGGGISAH